MHDPAVVAPRAGGFDGAGITDRGVGPVDDFFLGVLGLPTWQALSLRAMVHVALRVVGELALAEKGRPPVEIRQREERPDAGVFDCHDVLDRAVGGVTRHLARAELTPEADPP